MTSQGNQTTFVDRLRDKIGQEFFVTDWFEIRQVDVDVFAAVTRDWDFMHNDPKWAEEEGPWPTTIASGFYLLSLLPHFRAEAGFPSLATEDEMVVNYGLDRVRFTEPVLVGDQVRCRFSLTEIVPKRPGRELIHHRASIETERLGAQPHVIADCLTLAVLGDERANAR